MRCDLKEQGDDSVDHSRREGEGPAERFTVHHARKSGKQLHDLGPVVGQGEGGLAGSVAVSMMTTDVPLPLAKILDRLPLHPKRPTPGFHSANRLNPSQGAGRPSHRPATGTYLPLHGRSDSSEQTTGSNSLKQWISGILGFVMPVIEVVWRHLLVNAREGRRRWSSVTALAGELGLAVSTTHRSLTHPMEIGAVDVGPIDGLQVLDPARLLSLLAVHRHVQRDVVQRWWVAASVAEVESAAGSGQVVLGGFGAVIAHLGVNRVADYTRVLFYGDSMLPGLPAAPPGEGTEVWIAEPDAWLSRYGRVTPLAQAYADLFSMPGWQAARFIEHLDLKTVAASDEPVLLV